MVRLLLRQFTSPIMVVLIGATVLSMLLGDRVDGAIILAIVLISGVLGFVQEHRADRTLATLAAMVRVHADVRRDGVDVEVPVDEVVVGDLVVLRTGDIVPADLRLTHSRGLLVDESSVTGESLPVEKGERTTGQLPGDRVFFGTHVVGGEGEGVVEAVGSDTRFGALVARLAARDVTTSFERSMTRFGYLLTQVMVVLVAIALVAQTLADRPVLQSLLFALALAVGITPQMLPAIVMVSLSSGARAMAAEEVLVRRLDVIEDIGAMSLLCVDKTGTLTTGTLTLEAALNADGEPDDRVLELGACNAGLQHSYPNPLDQAIVAAHHVTGTALDEIPYDFHRRRLSVLADTGAGRMIITKGAVDEVLACCTPVHDSVRALAVRMGEQGYRVIAIASRRLDVEVITAADEIDLEFAGFLIFADQATDEAKAAVRRLAGLGVEIAVISGDNRHVTGAVAHSVGIDGHDVVTGDQVAAVDESQLRELVRSVRVFAEIDPLQKERLVRAFQVAGHTVGFLGDGINDVAALRAADVGISVDGAADVAKQAAAIVVMTKSLDVICDATIMGRRTFANTLKYIRVTISANFGNMISMVVASFFLPFLPMLPIQILLLNLLSDAPALAIAGDAVDQHDLRQPQVWSLREVRRFMIGFGLVSSVIDISGFLVLRAWLNADASTFHTAWFLLSLLTEVIALLVLRTSRPFHTSRPAPMLLGMSALTVLLGAGFAFSPIGADFGLVPLSGKVLTAVLLLAGLYLVANELAKRVRSASRLAA